MTTKEIIRKHLRDFLIACVAVGIYLLVFGILLAVFLTRHTLFRRALLSGECIGLGLFSIVYSVVEYVRC